MMRLANVEGFQITMLNWYKQNGRHLPWRGTDDPYKIMIAELLLQKTDVEKVKVVYEKFVGQWPTIQLLNATDFYAVANVIEPLGLKYKTARLKSLAHIIFTKFGGKIPETTKMLMELPGIGLYIASAIECFAYNKRTAILDTNVVRVLNRVLEIISQEQRPRDDPRLWDLAQELLPHDHVKEYNWALLDFGSLVCRSRRPLCNMCTIQCMCKYYKINAVRI